MPTPREQAKKLGLREPDYCGVCGVPGRLCTCLQHKERGVVGAVKAGSASADRGPPMKGAGGGEKKSMPGALPFGEKKEE